MINSQHWPPWKQYKGVCCTTNVAGPCGVILRDDRAGGRGGLEIYPPDRQIRIDSSDLATAKLYFCISFVHEQILMYNICMISTYDYHTMIYCTSAYFPVGAHDAHWLLTFELNSPKEHSSTVTKDRLCFWASPYLLWVWYEQLPTTLTTATHWVITKQITISRCYSIHHCC